jgi:DNA-binding transcriptional regulator YhcF (GntR family)
MQKKQKIVTITSETRQAKYRQIINSIIEAIATGRLKRGDKVPSINDIAKEYGLSRDTVMLAFNELKARGIIASVAGIGYFVESTNVALDQKIFLLFDEFNSFKENLYNSFLESLSGKASVDIFFHHFNKRVFEGLIRDNLNRYTSFAILPGNLTQITSILEALPADKVYILDQFPDELKGKYPGVYQAFDEEVYNSMNDGKELLQKYRNFVLVHPGGKEPIGFQTGFERFCNDFNLLYEIIPNLKGRIIRNGEVYILPNDSDLVTVIKSSASLGLKIGHDVGIISINDTPLKEVVQGGITTITTDFTEMGRTLARMILNQEKGELKNPSQLIIRNSL